MNFLKVSGRDISGIFKNRFLRVSVVAIIIVPLLYSLLYLAAFWDPYAKLKSMPVAVVNLDEGTMLDGKSVNYGKDVVEKLKNNEKIGWRFVSFEDAKSGVEGDKYYGMFVIPESFSKNALSAKDGKPEKATILFQGNEKRNFLAAQINGKVTLELKQEISKNISDEYTKVTFDNLYDIKDGMVKAAEGSGQLSDGLDQARNGVAALYEGAEKLNRGIKEAKDGSGKLNDGLGQLSSKVPSLVKGTSDLYNGVGQLDAGIKQADNGIKQLNEGIKTFNENAVKPVSQGISALDSSLNEKILPSMAQLKDGSSKVAGGVDTFIASVSASQEKLKGAVDTQLMAYLAKHPEAMKDPDMAKFIGTLTELQKVSSSSESQKSIGDLKTGTQALNAGLNQLYEGVNGEFKSGLDKLNGSMPQVIAGSVKLYEGSGSLAKGMGDISLGSSALKAGVKQLSDKAPELQAGAGELFKGSTALEDGLNLLYDGSTQLKSSIAKPEEVKDIAATSEHSDKTLFEGITQLKDGSSELKDKLTEGADEISGSLKNDSKTMGEFVSEPVILNEEPINPVKNYGTGFTSYFIPLSLWVGALMMFFVITDKVDDDLEGLSSTSLVLGKFLSYGYIGVLQAVLVSVIVLMLGLKPNNVVLYFVTNIFMSFVFIAIMQSLIFLLGQAGRLLSIVLLILQLTSSAGTFPLEVLPKFFKVLNPLMPFTYCTQALREAISGVDYGVFAKDILVLGITMIVFLIISVGLKGHADKLQNRIQSKKQSFELV